MAQLHAFRSNSTRFGSTPHVFFAQLHAFSRSNSTPPQTQATRHIKGLNARVAHASHARASRAAARLRAKRGKEARETTHRATERSPETHPARGPRTATKESGLPADSPRGARVARRVSRAPHARSWSGCLRRGEERSEGAACAERREESSEAQNARHANTGRELRERTARLPARRARRVARCVRRAPAHVVSAPPPARGRSEGAARAERDRQNERSTKEEKTTARERPCSTAAVMNHPRCTCAARVARAPPVALRAPLPHPARSGDRREGARQGRRPATEAPRRTRPPQRATSVLNCGGENHPRCAAPSIDRRFEPRASALLRAGTRPTALDYGGSAGDIVRRRSERVWRVRERSRGYSAERASSPRSQSKIIDDSTHLEPRRAANCIADSIGRCRLDGGQQLVLDRVSTDRRTFCGGRRVPTEPRSSASLDASGCPHRAREQWGTVHRLNAWNECPSVDVRRWLMAFPIFVFCL